MLRTWSALLLLAGSAFGQGPCAAWSEVFRTPGSDGSGVVACATTFDDGSGTALYVGGRFGVLGESSSRNIARWNGARWSSLGAGLGAAYPASSVNAFAVYDEGSGPHLFAAGNFTTSGGTPAAYVARWDGTGWNPVGAGLPGYTYALAVYDDGTGARLFASSSSFVRVWDGTTWQPVPGLDVGYSMLVHDDGTGNALYLGRLDGVRRYTSTSITDLTGGFSGTVYAMAAYDDGTGARLYAATNYSGTQGVRRWDGSVWTAPPGPISGPVWSLATIDLGDGQGPLLYAAGRFTNAAGVGANRVVRMRGAAWEAYAPATTISEAYLTTSFGGTLFVGSSIRSVSEFRAEGLIRLDGSDWAPAAAGQGLVESIPGYGTALALCVFDPGSGPELFVGGSYLDAAPSTLWARALHWDGARWESASPPQWTGSSNALGAYATVDLGTGPRLYASSADGVQRYEGGLTWTPLPPLPPYQPPPAPPLPPSYPGSLITFDLGAGPRLLAGGSYQPPFSGPPPWPDPNATLFSWDGSSWHAEGNSPPGPYSSIGALAIHDDGTGEHLYAGGSFTSFAGAASRCIAQRTATGWTGLGGGIDDGRVQAMTSFDDGSGRRLYVAGTFTSVGGGVPARGIARWNGGSWSAVGTAGMGNVDVAALAVHDDGSGPALYAAGQFTAIGGVAANNIARWNGVQWTPLGPGTDGRVEALSSYDDRRGDGPSLYACGRFLLAGGRPSPRIAKWTCGGDAGFAYCFGDGVHAGSSACPCGNFGATGHGCANSADTNGARLVAHGSTGLDPATGGDTIALETSGLPATTMVLFVKGSAALGAGTVFGDGLRCVGGALVRLGTQLSAAGIARHPGPGSPPVSVGGSTPIGSGATAYYQSYYRNSMNFCTSATFNLSNGVVIRWGH
ncbi:MAG: hypothetical protein NTY35_12470 [Planctomycetota bacterium]|nr:hypothetical protein [Planctomycetota bacterium]